MPAIKYTIVKVYSKNNHRDYYIRHSQITIIIGWELLLIPLLNQLSD